MMPRLVVSAVLLVLAATGSASAQTQSIDIEDAVRIALEGMPALDRADAAIQGRRAERLSGLGLTGPTIALEREGIPNGGGGFGEERFGVSQEIPFPTAFRSRLRLADASVAVASASRSVLEADVREAVRTAYVEVVYYRELLKLRERAVGLGTQLLESVTARIEVGESAVVDLLKAQLQEAEARDLADEAERGFQAARYSLFRAMGLDPETQRYSIAFTDSMRFVDVVVDQESIVDRLAPLPEMVVADASVTVANRGRSVARGRLLPNLIFGYWAQDLGSGYEAHAFELGVRLPLEEWLGRGASARRAEADVRIAEADRRTTVLDIKEDVEKRWHSYDISRRTLLRYETNLQGRGELLVQLTREGYQLGELDLLTLLDAQRMYVASQVRYLTAMRSYQRDLVRLERYVGRRLVSY